ncbi:rCG33137 [Rattus norvegicus]|uniref:RCG33137 n=1 Tax=Rattus norvegicus TaxID=10116 RepID=A6HEQ6_RAT|nr:rCG33137 [Rattus norvegicus]
MLGIESGSSGRVGSALNC